MAHRLFQLKITLVGAQKPAVWRRILVPSRVTFYFLHYAIQEAMGWWNSHMYQFTNKPWGDIKWYIIEPDPYSDDKADNEQHPEAVRLYSIIKRVGQKIYYTYDFGDTWVHEILLEKVIEDEKPLCKCLTGRGSCPPEDCGGIPGFEEMKRVLREEPKSDEALEYLEWLDISGLDFIEHKEDILKFDDFSLRKANDRLRTLLYPGMVVPDDQLKYT